jgi:protein-disulfide isomerase
MMKNIVFIICLALFASAFAACGGGKTGGTGTNTAQNKTAQKLDTVPPTASAGAVNPPTKGSPTATVVLEEFADYQCGACASLHPKMQEVYSKYGSRIKFIFRNFPLKNHNKAYEAAVATEAAAKQGKFWEMQNLLFSKQRDWMNSTDFKKVLEDFAKQLDLNYDQFTTDTAGFETKSRVDADLQRGNSIGITSTPTIILNNRILTFEEAQNIMPLIDAELAKSGSQQTQSATTNSNSANSANTGK